MSADGSVTLAWGGEERKFRLAIGQLRELQENINRWRAGIGAPTIGPRTLLRILAEGDAWPDDVREVIRLGLIGGGMKIARVPALVKIYVDDRPLLESTSVAQAILLIALVGDITDQVGQKKTSDATAGKTSATTGSASPTSTEPDAPLGSPPEMSTQCPSGSSPLASMVGTEPTTQTQAPRP